MSIGEKIYDLRRRQDLTQDELAARTGVSKQVVTKWELGMGEPTYSQLVAIADCFGVDVTMFSEEAGDLEWRRAEEQSRERADAERLRAEEEARRQAEIEWRQAEEEARKQAERDRQAAEEAVAAPAEDIAQEPSLPEKEEEAPLPAPPKEKKKKKEKSPAKVFLFFALSAIALLVAACAAFLVASVCLGTFDSLKEITVTLEIGFFELLYLLAAVLVILIVGIIFAAAIGGKGNKKDK